MKQPHQVLRIAIALLCLPVDISWSRGQDGFFDEDTAGIPRGKERISWPGPEKSNVEAVAFSPDGKLLAIGRRLRGNPNGFICIRAVQTGQVVAKWNMKSPPISLAFSPDGKFLVSPTYEADVELWEVGTWKPLRPKPWPYTTGYAAFTVDSKWVVTRSPFALWNLATGERRNFLAGQTPVGVIAISPDGKTLATGAYEPRQKGPVADRTSVIKFWDLGTGKEVKALPEIKGLVEGLAFSPDGRTLAVGVHIGSGIVIKLWDVARRECWNTLQTGIATRMVQLHYSPDGKMLAVVGNGGFLRLSNSKIDHIEGILVDEGNRCAAFSPDGNTIATGNYYGTVKIWDVPGRD